MAGANRVKAAKRLFDLEIDEVSVVDRAANQHATVAIAKRAEDQEMPEIYDAEGYLVDENELEHGDVVYDADGAEYVFVDEDAAGDLEQFADDDDEAYYDEGAYDEDGELVGKAVRNPVKVLRQARALRSYRGNLPGKPSNWLPEGGMSSRQRRALRAGIQARSAARGAAGSVRGAGHAVREGAERAGRRAQVRGLRSDIQFRSASSLHPYRTAAASAGVGGVVSGLGVGATEAHRRGVNKSLGDSVLEELSKALTQADHDQVISKAMDLVEVYKGQADEAYDLAYSLAEERELEQFEELAKSYGLPVDSRALGETLYNVAKSLPAGQVQMLDRLLTAVGDQLYDELGTSGSGQTSSIMGEIEAIASSAVGKSDGLTTEQAIVGLFESNPDAYDEYISEQRFR